MTQRFTAKAENALRNAEKLASSLGHTYLGSEHLLFGLAAEHEGVASRLLEGAGVNSDKIRETVSLFTGIGRPSSVGHSDMTPRVRKIIEVAGERAAGSTVGTEHLLLALLLSDGSVAKKVLTTLGTDLAALQDDVEALWAGEKKEGNKRNIQKERKPLAFASYGRDLSEAAHRHTIDPLIGREKEMKHLIRILSRRTKNNPCLIGDPGVGKTAIVEGLALRIEEGRAPDVLLGKRLFSLDLSSLIAGAKYRGEFEERMRGVLESLKENPEVILFLDEIHTIVGAGAAEGAIDAANILKPAMARGEIRVIGATTVEEYRRHIEKDAALERRFQPILVEAPEKEEARAILIGLRPLYEKHHGLTISDEALDAAIELSVRYLPDRQLPDKALDLIDEAASELRLTESLIAKKPTDIDDIIRQKESEKETAVLAQNYERATLLRDEIGVLLQKKQEAEKKKPSSPTVSAALIAETVSDRTGIPVGRLTAKDEAKLASLEGELRERGIGQEEAVAAVSRAVRRARTGVRDPRRPIGSFLFLGPTGVGKTELCRALAEAYFGSERSLLRFDMSEYGEKHTVSRLVGTPPGYVGYEEGGHLTERIRRRPYSLVLFDEIEKAHPDIYHLLLQILEDGILTDGHGRTVEFRNAIIILTSNIGSSAGSQHALGFANIEPSENRNEQLRRREAQAELRRHFHPELLNRLDEIVLFKRLGKPELRRIAKKLLTETLERMAALGYPLSANDEVLDFLTEAGYSEEYGAREIRRAVLRLVEDRFSLAVVEGKIHPGEPHVTTVKDGELSFQPTNAR